MTLSQTVEFIKRMDINYNKEYHKNVDYINEWYKDLQFYDNTDVNNSFDKYLQSTYSETYPKRWALLNPIKTIKQKEQLTNVYTICPICLKKISIIDLDYDKHYGKCMDINFINKYVKKYFNKEINFEEYYNMSDEELEKRFDKIARIIIEKEPDGKLSQTLKIYFKNK